MEQFLLPIWKLKKSIYEKSEDNAYYFVINKFDIEQILELQAKIITVHVFSDINSYGILINKTQPGGAGGHLGKTTVKLCKTCLTF